MEAEAAEVNQTRRPTLKAGPHRSSILTVKQVESANLESGLHTDGGGLYLQVDVSGARRWLLRVRIKGQDRRIDMSLGSAIGNSAVTLKEARDLAGIYRKMAKDGQDPVAARRARWESQKTAARPQKIKTFRELAEEYIEAQAGRWREGSKHPQQFRNTLRDYALPIIGTLSVDKIDTPEILAVIIPPLKDGGGTLWSGRRVTAVRLRQRIKEVLEYATALKLRSGPNPVDGVKPGRGLPKKKHKVRHLKALPYTDAPKFVRDLYDF